MNEKERALAIEALKAYSWNVFEDRPRAAVWYLINKLEKEGQE